MDPEWTLNGRKSGPPRPIYNVTTCRFRYGSNHNGGIYRTKIIDSLEDKKLAIIKSLCPNSYSPTIRDGKAEEMGVVSSTKGEYQAHKGTNKQRKTNDAV